MTTYLESSPDGDTEHTDQIAIVGMAGRFPGASDITQFWHNLKHEVESITHFTNDEVRQAGADEAVLNDPFYVKAGSILEDVDLFDAAFFGLVPREAQIMDPQQRLFLESCWNALEHAGYDPAAMRDRLAFLPGQD